MGVEPKNDAKSSSLEHMCDENYFWALLFWRKEG